MSTEPHPPTLDAIRAEIDVIDDQLLQLLARRAEASAKVRQVKKADGSLTVSPVRPGREAAILRRLVAQRPPSVDAELLVRLWRVILTSSTLAQAPVTLHISDGFASDYRRVAAVAGHFGATPLRCHANVGSLLDCLNSSPGDLAAVEANSPWAPAFLSSKTSTRVIGRLPVLKEGAVPAVLVLGHASSQPTGDDETLVLAPRGTPLDPSSNLAWRCDTPDVTLVGLHGYLDICPPGWSLAGRYPASLEVR